MREDRRKHYDDGFRREALELIKTGAGGNTLARRLAIPVYTARNWIMLYRSGGEEAVMGGNGSRRYDWETKVAAARDHVENGMAKTEVMRSTRSRASRRWNDGAASTGREARRRSGRGPRAGPEARNPNRSPNPRASRSSPNRSPT